jgi:hypothetical protein
MVQMLLYVMQCAGRLCQEGRVSRVSLMERDLNVEAGLRFSNALPAPAAGSGDQTGATSSWKTQQIQVDAYRRRKTIRN